jgi:hypothetical protein
LHLMVRDRTKERGPSNTLQSFSRTIGDGVLLNKPSVLASGDWLLPAAVWKADNSIRVHASADQGRTFRLRDTANVPDPALRGPDEPMTSSTTTSAPPPVKS